MNGMMGILASESSGSGASAALNKLLTENITPMAQDMGTALIAVVGAVLTAMIGFLAVKYGLPVALQWIRRMIKQ